MTSSPSVIAPDSRALASLSPIADWTSRRSGRAPYTGSNPVSASHSLAAGLTVSVAAGRRAALPAASTCRSTILVSSDVDSESKMITSSSRLRNSGLNAARTAVITASRFARSSRAGSAMNAEPRFEVRIRIVLRKSTVLPCPSVSRPSSRTCSSTSKTSGCAFSTSSSSTTQYGPPPHRLGELPALLVADVAGRRADQARDRVLLAVLAHVDADHRPLVVEQELGQRLGQLGLADAGRPEEQERPGRAGPGRTRRPAPGAPRRTRPARRAACPITRLPSSSSIRSSLPVSPSSSRPAGMPVHADTTSATSSGPTSSFTIGAAAGSRSPSAVFVRAVAGGRLGDLRVEGGDLAVQQPRSRLVVAVPLGALGLALQVVELLLQLADPVEAGLLLLPARGQRGELLLPVGQVGAQLLQPVLARRVGLAGRARAPPSSSGPRCGAARRSRPGRSRSPSAAGTRPRRPGRSPCRAGTWR